MAKQGSISRSPDLSVERGETGRKGRRIDPSTFRLILAGSIPVVLSGILWSCSLSCLLCTIKLINQTTQNKFIRSTMNLSSFILLLHAIGSCASAAKDDSSLRRTSSAAAILIQNGTFEDKVAKRKSGESGLCWGIGHSCNKDDECCSDICKGGKCQWKPDGDCVKSGGACKIYNGHVLETSCCSLKCDEGKCQ